MDASVLSSPAGPSADASPPFALGRSVALVGLMGAGKSSVGRRLAKAIEAPFADADDEIVAAAGMSIPEIFASFGEPAFRDLERRVVSRMLDQAPMVMALGGGAFIDPATRAKVKERACSVWFRAELAILAARVVRKRASRPLLQEADPRATLERLMTERYPIYAEADHVIDTGAEAPDTVVARLVEVLASCRKVAG